MSDGATIALAGESIRVGSKSFAAAARLFRPEMRESAVLLYAWCRHCDDVIDGQALGFRNEGGAASDPQARLAEIERETRAALAGDGSVGPAFAGLRIVAERHAIPQTYPFAHLDGFRMDVAGRRYRTIADTLDYAYHVAGVVGLMMAHVMGVRDPAVLDRACDLGIAFQLTNIARDIVEDACAGRVYVPLDWLRDAGVPATELAHPVHRTRVVEVAGRLLDVAEPYYGSAEAGIAHLPGRAAWAIATASRVYRAIGTQVRRRGAAAWDERVSTSRLEKLRHVAAGGIRVLARGGRRGGQPLRTGLYARPL